MQGIAPRTSFALDTTRWAAAALVLAYHLSTACLAPGASGPLLGSLEGAGPAAVIWFFVLSGYLIGGGIVLDMRRGRFRFARYALNRATRLYVVLLPALALGYALDSARVLLAGLSPVPGQEAPASYAAATVLGNLLCLQTITVPTLGSNGPLWSLACEGFYYVLAPLLLAPLLRSRHAAIRWSLFALAALMLCALWLGNPRVPRLFLTWLLGTALRSYTPRQPHARRLGPLAWIVAVAVLLAYPMLLPRVGGAVNLLVAASFAAALLTTIGDERPVPAGAQRLSATLAGSSFSLYLVHVPIIHGLLALWTGSRVDALRLPLLAGHAAMLALAAIVIPLAWLFSRLTEARTETMRRWLGAPRQQQRQVAHCAGEGDAGAATLRGVAGVDPA